MRCGCKNYKPRNEENNAAKYMDINSKLKSMAIYLVPLILAGVLKFFVSPVAITPFNADEAIVALMARHINQGDIPIFFYGQSYMGSLDAILVAVGFRIFGEGIWVIRMLQSVLYLGTILTTMMLASRLLGNQRAALYAGLFMAVPPVNATLYSTVSLGGYGEMLLVGNLLLLGGIPFISQIKTSKTVHDHKLRFGLFLWGIGAGFAFWIMGLTLVYTIPVAGLILWQFFKKGSWKAIFPGLILLAGGIVGSAPWWFSAVQSADLGVLTELAGGAISGAGTGPKLMRPLNRIINLFVFGGTALLGLRPPWGIRWLMLPLIPLILIFWLTVMMYHIKYLREKAKDPGLIILILMGVVLAAGFIFSPYGDDPSGRYFLPLMTPLAISGAHFLSVHFSQKRFLEYTGLFLVIIFNLGGNIQSAFTNPPGITTQFDKVAQIDQNQMPALIRFLRQEQIKAGYSNYWVSYPLAFLSAEELIFLPSLPYHEDFRYTARDDRYPPYQEVVREEEHPAYITTNHQHLDEYLVTRFLDCGITWEEAIVGDFHIFYNLSPPVRVDELDLGETTTP
jgi:4-amino-4-deoxy-L-arabinose transferase-like glycosyltransferase